VIVHDIKGENWEITAPWRSLFSHCIYWNPTSEHSAKYNPLREIRRDHNDVRDARNIVEFLANPEGDRAAKDFWTTKAKDLLTAAILHVIYAGEDKSLRGVLSLLRSKDIQETFEQMRSTPHRDDGKPHPVVEQAINDLLNSSEKTWQGVLSTATSFLGLWDDELLARATSGTDFRPQDLQHGDHPVSLYIVVPPNDLERLAPIIKLMFTQIVARLTENLDPDSIKHKLLLLIDELPALGGWDWLESALAYVRGYDIKCLLIAQDLNQLEKAYGPKNAILGNCHIRVAFATNDDHTAQRISSLLGDTTATKETESLSGKRGSLSLENKSESTVEFGRPLLTPGEIGQLPDDEELVFLAGQPPIRAKKVRYYANPHFQMKCGQWNQRFEPLQIGGDGWPDVPPRDAEDPFYSRAPAAAPDSEPSKPDTTPDTASGTDAPTSPGPPSPADDVQTETAPPLDEAPASQSEDAAVDPSGDEASASPAEHPDVETTSPEPDPSAAESPADVDASIDPMDAFSPDSPTTDDNHEGQRRSDEHDLLDEF
jgi:type IV secretion system protein VirD4